MDLLKKQLVSLTVELDDKTKIIQGLKRRLAAEENQLATLEQKIPAHYDHLLTVESEEQKQQLAKLIADIKKLHAERESLREQCRQLKDEALQYDESVRQSKIESSEQMAMAVEQQSKAFRAGFDTRLQKFLAKKAAEVKENTFKELQPIFQKIRLDYERETGDIDRQSRAEEAKVRSTMQTNLQETVDYEEKLTKEDCKTFTKHQTEMCNKQLEELSYEYKFKKQQLTEELEEQLRKETNALNKTIDQQRAAQASELNVLQQDMKDHLGEVRDKHESSVTKQKRDHEAQMKQLDADYETRKAEIERRVRNQVVYNDDAVITDSATKSPTRSPTKRSSGGRRKGNDDSDQQHPDAASQEEGGGTAMLSPSRKSLSTPDRGSPKKSASGSKSGASGMSVSEREREAALQEYRSKLEAERDKRIQQEIKSLQYETVKLEREWKRKHSADRAAMQQQREAEEVNLSNRLKELNHWITDGIVEKEQLVEAIRQMKQAISTIERECSELKQEISVYENGIALHTNRIRDKQAITNYKVGEEEVNLQRQIKELQQRYKQAELKIQNRRRESDNECNELQGKHDNELAELEKQVKASVAIKDREIAALSEDITLEQNRMESLQEILRRYNNTASGRTGGGGAAGASSSSSSVASHGTTSRRPLSATSTARHATQSHTQQQQPAWDNRVNKNPVVLRGGDDEADYHGSGSSGSNSVVTGASSYRSHRGGGAGAGGGNASSASRGGSNANGNSGSSSSGRSVASDVTLATTVTGDDFNYYSGRR